jgi:signal transduction histidine kinase
MLAAGVTQPPAPRPARLRRGPFDLVAVADAVLAVILFGLTNSTLGSENAAKHSPHSVDELVLVSFLVCAPLLLRTRFPLSAWAASGLAMIVASLAIPPHSLSSAAYIPAAVVVYALCLYAVAVRCKPWVVIGAAALTAIGAGFIDLRTTAVAVLVSAIPLILAVIVRSRRGSRQQLEMQERRHEGERALLEERQRIARELHDVVAHHMSVIAIQAEAALYKTTDPPEELVESFTEIRGSALSGLNELRRVLGVLRNDRAETAPQPGLEDLAGLVDSARSGGVSVKVSVNGTPRPLADGINLSAYRILQEALSNAMQHAPGSAVRVRISYQVAYLVISVRNDSCTMDGPAAEAGSGAAGERPAGGHAAGERFAGGHGIIGMRERATMLGGHLEAGPTREGEFLVTAVLPLGDGHLVEAT